MLQTIHFDSKHLPRSKFQSDSHWPDEAATLQLSLQRAMLISRQNQQFTNFDSTEYNNRLGQGTCTACRSSIITMAEQAGPAAASFSALHLCSPTLNGISTQSIIIASYISALETEILSASSTVREFESNIVPCLTTCLKNC